MKAAACPSKAFFLPGTYKTPEEGEVIHDDVLCPVVWVLQAPQARLLHGRNGAQGYTHPGGHGCQQARELSSQDKVQHHWLPHTYVLRVSLVAFFAGQLLNSIGKTKIKELMRIPYLILHICPMCLMHPYYSHCIF